MEVRGQFEKVFEGWVYASVTGKGQGKTPEEAYGAWLDGFDYHGDVPTINNSDDRINSVNTDKEPGHG